MKHLLKKRTPIHIKHLRAAAKAFEEMIDLGEEFRGSGTDSDQRYRLMKELREFAAWLEG